MSFKNIIILFVISLLLVSTAIAQDLPDSTPTSGGSPGGGGGSTPSSGGTNPGGGGYSCQFTGFGGGYVCDQVNYKDGKSIVLSSGGPFMSLVYTLSKFDLENNRSKIKFSVIESPYGGSIRVSHNDVSYKNILYNSGTVNDTNVREVEINIEKTDQYIIFSTDNLAYLDYVSIELFNASVSDGTGGGNPGGNSTLPQTNQSSDTKPEVNDTLDKDQKLLSLLIRLEKVKTNFETLKLTTISLSDHYKNAGNQEKSTSWKTISDELSSLVGDVENIKTKVKQTRDTSSIKPDIDSLRSKLKILIDLIIKAA